ncbi:hypothetical protein SAMN06265173_1464 [Thalassovita litoralis]|jgi:hypothetical protein|uniref:YCII-related domain-containing protein n=1 Tax=Thalassovita litoralis TaxID=1010611 RepID=A0A521FR79_9RHOB|nr:YciI family protein [Thalassovita litoralis]SMO98698.1 hypothetical protein SAMN06265173_1464 [Thalassovita litoralis]
MYVSLIARDKPGALDIRKANRAEHLAYIEATGIVVQAGPLLDDAEEMCGSLVILDVDTMEQAENWAANDPYAKAGLFDNVELIRWKKVIG